MSDEQQNEEGTLLVGGDGSVYFIPSTELESYRISDDEAGQVNSALAAADDDVSGFSMQPARSGDISFQAAVKGPFVQRIGGSDGTTKLDDAWLDQWGFKA